MTAVSGATLTSLALAEGVLKRIGGGRPSLFFPDPVSVSELDAWIDEGETVENVDAWVMVRDQGGNETAQLLRTGPLTDDIAGNCAQHSSLS